MSFAVNPTWCIFLHENVEINVSVPCSLSYLCSFAPLSKNRCKYVNMVKYADVIQLLWSQSGGRAAAY